MPSGQTGIESGAGVPPPPVNTVDQRPSQSTTEPVDVLAVDDDPRNRAVLRALIVSLGARLVEASSGEDALRRLLQQDFGLILLDLHMPGMDGLETAALIRSRERSRFTPIIFLTAYDRSEEQLVRGYRLGAVDFLSKPIQPPEILTGKVSFFIESYRKTREIQRQWELIRAAEQREHVRNLDEIRRRLEQEALQREVERERQTSEERQRANEQLQEMAAERARLIEELQVQAAELRDVDRRKDEFLATLAHELRNPLAPIVNALGYLVERGTEDPAVERVLTAATRQTRHMARLVEDLVDVSRIRSGKIALQRKVVDVAGVIADAVHAVEPLVLECRHELAVEVPPDPVAVDVDPVRLAQVLENLLNNAAKYTEPGGHLALRVTREEGDVVIAVSDDGRGIDPELQRRVFDLFVQCERTADLSRGGLGLGLSLVRSLVQMHGGTVSVHSEGAGKGSTFTVRLPTVAEAPVVAPARAPMAPTASLRIAIVEDSEDIRGTLRALLELRGHVVVEACDGAGGIKLVVDHHPDVALIDIGLPGMDGFSVAEAIRAAGSDSRLVAVTGFGRPEDRARALASGFDAHLVKPVDPADLQTLLHQLAS